MYSQCLADFIPNFQVLACRVKNVNIWHDCFAFTTTKEAYAIAFNSPNTLALGQ